MRRRARGPRLPARGARATRRAQRNHLGGSARLLAAEHRDLALERRHTGRHRLQRVGDRVGQVDPVGVRALGAAPLDPDRMAGVADHGRVRRHLVDDDRVGADLRAVADRDRAEQLRAGADRHVVLHRRMALAGLEAGAAERHALVHRHVGADLGRLADHHAHAVVDEQPVADPGGRVDLDPRQRAREVGQRARHRRHARGVQRVRDTVRQQRVQAGPADEDLERRDVPGRGIALAYRGHVAPQFAGEPADRTQTQHPF